MAGAARDDARWRLSVNLRRHIQAQGFENAEAFASAVGCSTNSIYVILRMASAARIDMLDRLAKTLGLDVSDLLKRPADAEHDNA